METAETGQKDTDNTQEKHNENMQENQTEKPKKISIYLPRETLKRGRIRQGALEEASLGGYISRLIEADYEKNKKELI